MNMRIFVIAGEASGDHLGAGLMQSLLAVEPDIQFMGVGGPAMRDAGLESLYPLEELAVMGFLPVLKNLPRILARLRETVAAVLRMRPDALVIIDSPDFTHRVARQVRQSLPDLPVIDYVSPTVWAWRQGRARQMRAYIDHVLALLPFEPEAYRKLRGPLCSYVGHPLAEKRSQLEAQPHERLRRVIEPPRLVVLPGSRRAEIERLMPVFAATLPLLAAKIGTFEALLPAVPHLEPTIREMVADWPIKPRLLLSEAEKYEAFRTSRAALAASGTVTLELSLAQVPMAVAYKVAPVETLVRPFIKVPSIVLPNLILGENVVPEFLQEKATPEALADLLAVLMTDAPERRAQMAAFSKIAARLALPEGETPSARAAAIVLETMRQAAFIRK
jgi:lipid-A-disaccharide synthase